MKTFLISAIAIALSLPLTAAERTLTTTVNSLDQADNAFGGCHISLPAGTFAANSISGSCVYADYVSFNCNGSTGPNGESLNSKSDGVTKFSQAQLAFVTSKPIFLVMNDAVAINGICWARAITVKN